MDKDHNAYVLLHNLFQFLCDEKEDNTFECKYVKKDSELWNGVSMAAARKYIIENGSEDVDEEDIEQIKDGKAASNVIIHTTSVGFSLMLKNNEYIEFLKGCLSILTKFKMIDVDLSKTLRESFYRSKTATFTFSKAAKTLLAILLAIWSKVTFFWSNVMAGFVGPSVFIPLISIEVFHYTFESIVVPLSVGGASFLSGYTGPFAPIMTLSAYGLSNLFNIASSATKKQQRILGHGFIWTNRYIQSLHELKMNSYESFFSIIAGQHITEVFNSTMKQHLGAFKMTFYPDPVSWKIAYDMSTNYMTATKDQYVLHTDTIPSLWNDLKFEIVKSLIDDRVSTNIVLRNDSIEDLPPILDHMSISSFAGLSSISGPDEETPEVAFINNALTVFDGFSNKDALIAVLKNENLDLETVGYLIDEWKPSISSLSEVEAAFQSLVIYINNVQKAFGNLLEKCRESVLWYSVERLFTYQLEAFRRVLINMKSLGQYALKWMDYFTTPVFYLIGNVKEEVIGILQIPSDVRKRIENIVDVTTSSLRSVLEPYFISNATHLIGHPDEKGPSFSMDQKALSLSISAPDWMREIYKQVHQFKIMKSMRLGIEIAYNGFEGVKHLSLNEMLDLRLQKAMVEGNEMEYKWCTGMKLVGSNMTEMKVRNTTNNYTSVKYIDDMPLLLMKNEQVFIENSWKNVYNEQPLKEHFTLTSFVNNIVQTVTPKISNVFNTPIADWNLPVSVNYGLDVLGTIYMQSLNRSERELWPALKKVNKFRPNIQ